MGSVATVIECCVVCRISRQVSAASCQVFVVVANTTPPLYYPTKQQHRWTGNDIQTDIVTLLYLPLKALSVVPAGLSAY